MLLKAYGILALFFVVIMMTTAVVSELANASGDYWIARAPIPTPTDVWGGVGTLNGQIYVFGLNSNGNAVTWNYDPNIDSWTVRAPMPTSRNGFAIATYQNRIYVIGGDYWMTSGAPPTGANEMYDPATDKWTICASMPTSRGDLQANVVNSKIYLISGFAGNIPGRGSNVTSTTEVYDPSTDKWSTAAPIPNPVYGYSSAVIDEKIYVIGAERGNQVFDPKENSWISGKPPPIAITWAPAVATSGALAAGRIYVIGGETGGHPTNATQIYNPYDDSWTFGASFPTDASIPATNGFITERLGAAVLNDTIYIVGGIAHANVGFYVVTEQYVPMDYNGTIVSPRSTITSSPSMPEFLILVIVFAAVLVTCVFVFVRKRRTTAKYGHLKNGKNTRC